MPKSMADRTACWEILYSSLNLSWSPTSSASVLTPGQNGILPSSPHSVSYIESFSLTLSNFLCSVYMYPKESISFLYQTGGSNPAFWFQWGKARKKYFCIYPKILYAYGRIPFAWFCFIAKAIKPVTHTALDSSGSSVFQAMLEVASLRKLMKY